MNAQTLIIKNRRMAAVWVTIKQIEDQLHLKSVSAETRFNRQAIIDKAINVPDGSVALTRKYVPIAHCWLIGIEHESLPIIKGVDNISIINARFEPRIGKPLANPDKPIIGVGGEPDYLRDPDKWYVNDTITVFSKNKKHILVRANKDMLYRLLLEDAPEPDTGGLQCGSFPRDIDNGLGRHIEKHMDTDEYNKIAKQIFQTNDQERDPDSKTIANAIEHDGISPTGQVGLINR